MWFTTVAVIGSQDDSLRLPHSTSSWPAEPLAPVVHVAQDPFDNKGGAVVTVGGPVESGMPSTTFICGAHISTISAAASIGRVKVTGAPICTISAAASHGRVEVTGDIVTIASLLYARTCAR